MQRQQHQVIIVLVTCPTRTTAQGLARLVVQQRVAACVNVVPGIESVFRWEGKIDRAKEVLLIIKTTKSRFVSLMKTVKQHHPYEVPEMIALPIQAGFQPYLDWVTASVSS